MMRLFDYLIANTDRHDNNWLIKDGHIVAIDHGITFNTQVFDPDYDLRPKIADELVERVKIFINNTETLKVLCELLAELLPEDSVEAFRKRLRLLADYLKIGHEIR